MDQSLSEVAIGSKELEQLLIAINDVPEEDQAALTSRLKLLARLGVPDAQRVGTGRKARFDLISVFQVAIAVEMIQMSLSTEKAARLLTYAWPRGLSNILSTIGRAHRGQLTGESIYPAVITLSLERFDGLTKSDDPKAVEEERRRQSPNGRFTPIVGYGPLRRATSAEGYFDLTDPMKAKRISVINASSLAHRIGVYLERTKVMTLAELHAWCLACPYQRPNPAMHDRDG
ncbi:hypothetical protein CHU93_07635 [Sandarakinorhabdus cyanobacteriorum]|uniref:Uncharacterized protein n=1 Tax=Sandarakinorhabdus cyanobacteriorum TaxID=1981098 RepID=A0A255YJK4_9SPHN|nr:hypothetical protein [Sandarakinorhabdus cyanobacteriorum]OYQ29363.1 hypothetical protein CHU93_07635 [Sandarakinorhabdus cyanobacteriorum]